MTDTKKHIKKKRNSCKEFKTWWKSLSRQFGSLVQIEKNDQMGGTYILVKDKENDDTYILKKINRYIPQNGDVIEIYDQQYFVIENNGSTGVVCPMEETYYITNFSWKYGDKTAHFVRKATAEERERLGLK